MNNTELIKRELEKFDIRFTASEDHNDIFNELAAYLDHLVVHNFNTLISLLYRMDISEKKLNQLLRDASGINVGTIIAQLIIERQLQKIEARKSFVPKNDIPDDEKW